uniref:E3 ubiquitin-protein ligase NRDP1 domain-containing protein n=1 Tax=Phasianus colchicus TaxID=9054 RepID=A0A669Q3M3_PHACC
MGNAVALFQGDVDEDLLCPIFSGVLEEPILSPHCKQAFCSASIIQWFSQQQTYPVDCSMVMGCCLEMPKDELLNHSCIKHLRSEEQVEHEHQQAEQKCGIQLLQAYMHAVRSINPNLLNLDEPIKYSEILEWVSSLQPTCVTQWGGMNSISVTVLQAVIKSLVTALCPASILNPSLSVPVVRGRLCFCCGNFQYSCMLCRISCFSPRKLLNRVKLRQRRSDQGRLGTLCRVGESLAQDRTMC